MGGGYFYKMSEAVITRHGARRIKERIGLGKGSIQKNVEKGSGRRRDSCGNKRFSS